MIIVQVFVYAWLIVTLVHFSNLATGSRYIKVIRSSEGDYFTNPDENCDPNSCNSYNSTIISGFCAASKESCACAQCRCLSNAKTYIVREKRCMSLDEIRAYEATETTNGKCYDFVLFISFISSYEAFTLYIAGNKHMSCQNIIRIY